MGETTTYRVETVYAVTDQASRALGEIEKSAKKTADTATSLKTILLTLGGAAVVQKSWGALKHAIIGGNTALEQHRTVLTGITSMTTGASLDKAWARSAVSMERFHEMSWKSGVAVADLARSAAVMNGPLMQAGLKMTQIEDMTHNAVRAAGAFGMSAEQAADKVTQAILKPKMLEKDMFLRSLLTQSGMKQFDSKAFGEATTQDRAKMLQKALSGTNLNAFIEKQSNETFSGVIGNIKSHLEKLATSAGKPLFEAATKELVKIQGWIETNRPKLEEMGRSFGQHMMTAFGFFKDLGQSIWPLIKDALSVVKGVMEFASQHRDIIFNLAKGLMVYKGAQLGARMLGGGVSDARGFLGGIFGPNGLGGLKDIGSSFSGVKSGATSLASSFGTLLTKMPGVIGGLAKIAGIAYVGGSLLLGKSHAEREAEKRSAEQIKTAKDLAARRAEVKEMEESLKFIAGDGADPYSYQFASQSLQAKQANMKELAGGLAQKEEEVLQRAIKEGFVHESVQGGRRRLSLSPSAASLDQSRVAGHKAMMEELGEVFSHRAAAAQQEMRSTVPGHLQWAERWGEYTSRGMKGFFTEAITEAKKTDIDDLGQVNAPVQNVNITIQQVSAKDPNRWLAEMDDMVARRTRAPSSAKRALKSSPK